MAVALRLPFVNIAFPWRVLHVAPLRHVVLHPSIFHTQKHAKSVNRGVFARTYSRAAYGPSAVGNGLQQEEEDKLFMATALEDARKGAAVEEVPVGAVLVHDGSIVARAHNLVEERGDPTAHAEMLVIRQAAAQGLGRWDLQNASLYVTLEPCAMCAGAILISRVGTVVYGARSTLLGADGTWMQIFPCQHDLESPADNGSEHGLWPGKPHPTHPSLQVRRGVLAEESGALMKAFFQRRRIENDSKDPEASKGLCKSDHLM